ncbi:MAG: hypothetical protein QOD99_1601, partial [Chthoniobacter sp.]|nr:hypothetical protein [Chthoniobacter sp.]
MKNVILSLFVGLGLSYLTFAEPAKGDSLFDARSAKTPSVQLQEILGPKSAGIRYDKRMIHAAQLAAERAHKHSTSRCWSGVKDALFAANVVPSRPTTEFAKEAGVELQTKYGFTKLQITNPFEAPIGSVLVYGG